MSRLPSSEEALHRELQRLALHVGDSPALESRRFQPRVLWRVTADVRADLAYNLMVDAVDCRIVWTDDGNATGNLMHYARYYLPDVVEEHIREQRTLGAWWRKHIEDDGAIYSMNLAIERMMQEMVVDDVLLYLSPRDFAALVTLAAEGSAAGTARQFGIDPRTAARRIQDARQAAFDRIYDPDGTGEQTPEPPRQTRIHGKPITIDELLSAIAAHRAARNVTRRHRAA